jgi:hypothetical protein
MKFLIAGFAPLVALVFMPTGSSAYPTSQQMDQCIAACMDRDCAQDPNRYVHPQDCQVRVRQGCINECQRRLR